jgi:hypothetical protein
MSASAGKVRPWWWSPGPIVFGLAMLGACGAVLFEDRIVPQKPVDIRDRVTLPGGASFCDTVPLPPSKRLEGTSQPPGR